MKGLLIFATGLLFQYLLTSSIAAAHAFEEGMWDKYGITIHYDKSFECYPSMNLYVLTKNESVFQGKQEHLHEVVNAAKETLIKWCPDMTEIRVSGGVNWQWYYWGKVSDNNQWKLSGRLIEGDTRYLQPNVFPRHNSEDAYNNAKMLLAGDRFAYNPKEAARYMGSAVIGGDPKVQYHLGFMIANGIGHEKHRYKGQYWINKAANQGYQPAIDYLISDKKLSKREAKLRVEAELASRREGIVYKSDRFWQRYSNHELYSQVFSGELEGLSQRVDFQKLYIDFVGEYSQSCKKMLPATRDKVTFTTIEVTDDNGFISSQITDKTEIFIDPRFTATFEQYRNDIKPQLYLETIQQNINLLHNIQTKGFKQSILEAIWESQALELVKFFQQVPCDSATMFQMKENILRAATSGKSLQDDMVVIPNAEKESEPAALVANYKTFYEACLESLYRKNPTPKETFCNCVSTEARKRLKPDELDYYADDFELVWQRIDNTKAKDFSWPLQNSVSACRR